jgi:pilus assembly protein FimV
LASVADSSDDLADLESLLDSDDAAGSEAGLPDLDFDLEETGFAGQDELVDDLQSLEAELDDLTTAEEIPAVETPVAEEAPIAEVLDETANFSSEFDLDELEDLPDFTAETAAADVESGADQEIDLEKLAASDNEFDFLAGTDECATKLDLARAYLDMEDLDGAKELLQEVVAEGNDQQKTDARSLMDSIG